MEFIGLNYKKFFYIFCLCLVIWRAFSFFIYLLMKREMNEAEFTEVIPYLFIFMFGMSFVWLLISFGGGMHYFYKAQKLLSYILSLELFDNNNYSKSHIRENAWVFYTQECFLGDINGYPLRYGMATTLIKLT